MFLISFLCIFLGSPQNDSKGTNTSKPGSSTSIFKRIWKNKFEEIKENQSVKSKIKARDSSPPKSNLLSLVKECSRTNVRDPESSQNKDSKGANTSKAGSSTSIFKSIGKKEFEEIKENQSVKSNIKATDSSPPKSNLLLLVEECSRTNVRDPESSQNKDSNGANTSKAGSSTSQKGNLKKDNANAGKKKELEGIKANESAKPKSKGRDSSPPKSNPSIKKCSRSSTDTNPLTNSSTEGALLCGIGSTTKPTQNNRYDKKHTKCNAQNSCKKCSAHIDDDGGNYSMKSMETGATNAGKNGKGKGRKNQDYGSMETGAPITDRDRRGQRRRNVGDFSREFNNRSDHDSKKTDGPSTDRDKRGKGRPKPEDSLGEFVNQKSKMAKGADGSKLTKGKNYGKTPTQGIRSSLDDSHGSLEMKYDTCKDFQQDIQKMEVRETRVDPPVKRMEVKETCANPPDNDVNMAKKEGQEVKGRNKKGF